MQSLWNTDFVQTNSDKSDNRTTKRSGTNESEKGKDCNSEQSQCWEGPRNYLCGFLLQQRVLLAHQTCSSIDTICSQILKSPDFSSTNFSAPVFFAFVDPFCRASPLMRLLGSRATFWPAPAFQVLFLPPFFSLEKEERNRAEGEGSRRESGGLEPVSLLLQPTSLCFSTLSSCLPSPIVPAGLLQQFSTSVTPGSEAWFIKQFHTWKSITLLLSIICPLPCH